MTLSISGIGSDLSAKLIEEYLEIKKRFAMNDWGPGQLKGGRFAEVVLRIYQHLLSETVTPFGADIPAAQKTRLLNTVQNQGTIDVHIRQKTVPLVRLLLDFRNNRDAAHLGGFDANSMDTLFVVTSATWILCELVRVYGGYAMHEAQEIVDGLSVKEYPVIVERNGEMFIARHDLDAKQEALVLLTRNASASATFLETKIRDSNKSRVRRKLQEMVADMRSAPSHYKKTYNSNLSKYLANLTKSDDLRLVGNDTYALSAKKSAEIEMQLSQRD